MTTPTRPSGNSSNVPTVTTYGGTTPGSQGDTGWWPSDITYIWNYFTTDPLGAAGAAITGAGEGAAAAIDGAIPFWDPLSSLYDPCDETLEWSKWFGGAARNSLLLAGGAWTWNAAGLPTFGVGVAPVSGKLHVGYSITWSGGSSGWLHAQGVWGFMYHTTRWARLNLTNIFGYWNTLNGIPILFPLAGLELAKQEAAAMSCVTGAGSALLRSWFPFLPFRIR
jgi:hypothetical protein